MGPTLKWLCLLGPTILLLLKYQCSRAGRNHKALVSEHRMFEFTLSRWPATVHSLYHSKPCDVKVQVLYVFKANSLRHWSRLILLVVFLWGKLVFKINERWNREISKILACKCQHGKKLEFEETGVWSCSQFWHTVSMLNTFYKTITRPFESKSEVHVNVFADGY